MRWHYHLKLAPEYLEMESSLPVLAQLIADRLEALPSLIRLSTSQEMLDLEDERRELIEAFRDTDDLLTVGEFDSMMREFYDWANVKLGPDHRLCRVETLTAAPEGSDPADVHDNDND